MFSVLGASAVLLPAAALWLAAQALQPQPIAAPGAPLAISDLNAIVAADPYAANLIDAMIRLTQAMAAAQ